MVATADDSTLSRADGIFGRHRAASRVVASFVYVSISKPNASISRRSEAIRPAYTSGICNWSSSRLSPTPNRSLTGTLRPHLASTACTLAFNPERNATSLARCRTNSRSSRVAGGAIHASGRRPIRSRSARSAASRSSFFTRR